jgi:hypothetical protein
MLFLIYLLLLIQNIDSFLNIFTRSESTQLKERCGHSIILNNNYWLLKQTYQALKAIQNNQITFDILPWNRLSISIQQIYHACLIDDIKNSKERIYIHQTAIKAGSLLASKAKHIRQKTLIEIPKK